MPARELKHGWPNNLDKVLAKLFELRQLGEKSFEPDSGTGEEKKGKSDSAIKIVALAAYLKEKKATWSKDGKQFYVTDKGFEELEK